MAMSDPDWQRPHLLIQPDVRDDGERQAEARIAALRCAEFLYRRHGGDKTAAMPELDEVLDVIGLRGLPPKTAREAP